MIQLPEQMEKAGNVTVTLARKLGDWFRGHMVTVISHITSKLVYVTYLSYSVTIVVLHKSDNA